MPTVEERLEALERALSRLQSERVSLDERINTLQQQIAEQRRLLAEREQAIGQVVNEKFDTLMHVIVEHANAVTGRFAGLDANLHQHFTSIDVQLSRLAQQVDQHTADIKEANHNITMTWGVVQAQQADIREMKSHLGTIDGKVDTLDGKVDQQGRDIKDLNGKVDNLSSKVDQQGQDIKGLNSKFDSLGGKVDQQGQDIKDLNGKVDQQGQEIKTLSGKIDGLNGKFDHLDGKVDQQGTLLQQILDRLPPAS